MLLLATSIITNSCKKIFGNGDDCGDTTTVESASGLEIHIKDTTVGRFVYDLAQPIFKIDSLLITNSQGQKYSIYKSRGVDETNNRVYYAIAISGLYDSRFDTKVYEDTIRKDIYLMYTKNEYDTLNVSFKAVHAKCGGNFAFIKVMRKGKLLSYTEDYNSPTLTIKK